METSLADPTRNLCCPKHYGSYARYRSASFRLMAAEPTDPGHPGSGGPPGGGSVREVMRKIAAMPSVGDDMAGGQDQRLRINREASPCPRFQQGMVVGHV